MTDQALRIRELSAAQRELLLRRLAKIERGGQAPGAELVPQNGSALPGPEPVSFAQERQLFHDRLSPADPAHIIIGALRLTGVLDRVALQGALDAILERHAALRARFTSRDGRPVQVDGGDAELPVTFLDLSGEPEAACYAAYLAETERGFDLARNLLIRVTLIRQGERAHFLIFSMHHIVSDGWSIGLFLEELASEYRARVEDRDADLPPPAIRYGDFARWQRTRLTGPALECGLEYWRRRLAAPPPVLEPWGDGPGARSGGERDFSGASEARVVEPELRAALESVERRTGASLFSVMVAAYMALLMRVTGKRDVLIGTPVSGRIREETEGVIGLFLNTIALRAELDPGQGFATALERVHQAVLEGLEHHEVPFEQVVKDIAPDRTSGDHALFETMFNFTPSPPRSLDMPGLTAAFEGPPVTRSEFSQVLYVTEWQGMLELRLTYQTARFSAARIGVLLDQFLALLKGVAAEPDRPLGEIALDTPALPLEAADPARALPAPAQVAVTASIAQWAERTPDAVALEQGGHALGYAELLAGIRGIAAGLRAAGVVDGAAVAVTGRRSPALIMAMAAVLEARGVLVTLSPDLPETRHRVMLEEAGARVLLHAGPWREADAWMREVPGLTVMEPDPVHQPDAGALPPLAGPDDPAYLFFTSGSTGTPKAVQGSAGGLAHFLAWQRARFDVGQDDRFAQLTGLSFDVVLRDIFLPLTSGATLVLPEDDAMPAAPGTPAWLAQAGITAIHTVPSVMRSWLIAGPEGIEPRALRLVFSAGEPLTDRLVTDWRQVAPGARMVNLYGPTETTLAKCAYEIPEVPAPGIQPLGHALPDTQCLVLTPSGGRAGIGEIGEIAIRTPFRSLGYRNAGPGDAERFAANPFRNDPKDLVYRTGDRGVLGPDGLLHFLGRTDDQVKLRGIRVEPLEVSAVLGASPELAAAAVVPRTDTDGETFLAAYVVPAAGRSPTVQTLRDYLRQRLPAAMVPAAFAFMDALPLTANQKLDRARLPDIAPNCAGDAAARIAPRDGLELQLVQIWQELLGVDDVGITDDFFDLGGHSLLSLRLLLLIEQRIGHSVPLASLFQSATVAHLAEVIRAKETVAEPMVRLWAGSGAGAAPLFLVHTGGGTIWNYVPLVRAWAPGVPVHALQARGLFGEAPPEDDLQRMAADYVSGIRAVQPQGPYRLGGHSFGGVIAYEMARQLTMSGCEVAALVLFDSSVAPREASVEGLSEAEQAADDLAAAAAVFARFTGADVAVDRESLAGLDVDAQIARVGDAFREGGRGLIPDGGALVRNLLTVSRAHRAARQGYAPPPARLAPVLIRAAGEPARPERADPTLGWGALARGGVRVLDAPGDHVTMMTEANAAKLALCLASALDGTSSP